MIWQIRKLSHTCLLGLLLAACSVCRKSLKVWDPLCCSSIFWLKVWDGAQPDERVWTLATAGRAGGDRPATAPRIASHAHHPRSRIPDTPPANSTGPPRVHATMRRQNRTGHSCRRRTGIRATPRVPVTLRAGGVGAHRTPGGRIACSGSHSDLAGGVPRASTMAGAWSSRWTAPVPRWGLCYADACGSPFLRLGFIQHWSKIRGTVAALVVYIYTWPMGAWHVVDYQRLCWLIDCLAGVGKLSVINTIISNCSWLRWCLIFQNVT
jgi:hypothetical protein